jgi:hypothetical protein
MHGAGLDLQCINGRAVNFVGEFELAAGRRPPGDHEQDGGNHEIDQAKDGGCGNRAPDLHQREIGRQFQHQQAEACDQRSKRPQAETDQHVPHPDLRDDPVGAPQGAQVLDDIVAVHLTASSA